MEIPQSTLNRFKTNVKDLRTERGELLKEMLEVINTTRIGTFKPLGIARIGMLVAHIPTKDLYYLISVCKDSGTRAPNYNIGYAKRFWFELRPKNNK